MINLGKLDTVVAVLTILVLSLVLLYCLTKSPSVSNSSTAPSSSVRSS